MSNKETLQSIINDYSYTGLQRAVAESIAEEDNPKSYIEDLLQHGCVSGMVSELIYYHDTAKFYDKHYSDIETLRYDIEQECGECPTPSDTDDLKNFYAWLAYEETARYIANQIGLEV